MAHLSIVMDHQKIKAVSILLFITGVSFLFSQYQGVSGFVVGEGGVKFNMGILLILLSIILFLLLQKLQSREFPAEIDSEELKRQSILRNARILFIEIYAREPTVAELELFVQRMNKEGKLKQFE